MKNPPILVSVLGFFAALAGFGWLFFGLRSSDSTGSAHWATSPVRARRACGAGSRSRPGSSGSSPRVGLWALQPWARLFAQIMAGFALFEAVLAFFQFPGTGVGFAMAIMPAVILWYLNSREVKAAFGEGGTDRGGGRRGGTRARR